MKHEVVSIQISLAVSQFFLSIINLFKGGSRSSLYTVIADTALKSLIYRFSLQLGFIYFLQNMLKKLGQLFYEFPKSVFCWSCPCGAVLCIGPLWYFPDSSPASCGHRLRFLNHDSDAVISLCRNPLHSLLSTLGQSATAAWEGSLPTSSSATFFLNWTLMQRSSLVTSNLKTCDSSPVSPGIQFYSSNCLMDIYTWVSQRHFKFTIKPLSIKWDAYKNIVITEHHRSVRLYYYY